MKFAIENQFLRVEAEDLGAQLSSVYGKKEGIEYLWQGDERYWTGRAYNLFPIVARLYEKSYTLNGKRYTLGTHGFVRNSVLKVTRRTKTQMTFTLTDSPQTREVYPFSFSYSVTYAIYGRSLKVIYRAENTGTDVLPFAFGGHPGFRVPLTCKEAFTDYAVHFPRGAQPQEIEMTEDCFLSGKTHAFGLQDGKLPLRHDLFDHDAIVLENTGGSVLLRGKSGHGVRVDFSQMKYLGLWHKPKSDAPYLCIEPWESLPSADGKIEDITEKPDMHRLQAGERCENGFTVRVF